MSQEIYTQEMMDVTINEDSKLHDQKISDLYERVLLVSVEAGLLILYD